MWWETYKYSFIIHRSCWTWKFYGVILSALCTWTIVHPKNISMKHCCSSPYYSTYLLLITYISLKLPTLFTNIQTIKTSTIHYSYRSIFLPILWVYSHEGKIVQANVSFWQRVQPFMWRPSSVFWRAGHILACLLTGWLQRFTVIGCHLACDGCKKKPWCMPIPNAKYRRNTSMQPNNCGSTKIINP